MKYGADWNRRNIRLMNNANNAFWLIVSLVLTISIQGFAKDIDEALPSVNFEMTENDVSVLQDQARQAMGEERLTVEKKIKQSPSYQRPIRVRLLIRDLISMTSLPEVERFQEFKKVLQKNSDLHLFFASPQHIQKSLIEADLSGSSPRFQNILESIIRIKNVAIETESTGAGFVERLFLGLTEEVNLAISEIKFSEYPAFKEFTRPGAIDLSGAPPELQNFFNDLFRNYFDELELVDKRAILKAYLSLKPKSPAGMQAAKVLSACGPVVQKIFQQFCELTTDPYIREGGAALRESTPVFFNAKEIAEQRLGVPLSTYFQVFQSKPLAKASIGQVHLAYLHNDNEVVVKLLTPGIQEKAMREINAIRRAVTAPSAQPLIKRMEEAVLEETDLLKEHFYANIMKKIYNKPSKNIFPIGPIEGIPPKKDIIVLEKAKGKSLASLAYSDNLQELKTRAQATLQLLDVWFDQALETGYFHADFHPGNIFYYQSNREMTLHPIDPGAFGFLSLKERQGLMQLIGGMLIHSPEKIIESFDLFTTWKPGQREKVQLALKLIKIRDRSMSDVFSEIFDVILRNEVEVPISFMKFNRGRSFLELEIEKINKKYIQVTQLTQPPFSTESIYSKVISWHLWKELPPQLIGFNQASHLNKDQIFSLWLTHREVILEEKKQLEMNQKSVRCIQSELFKGE